MDAIASDAGWGKKGWEGEQCRIVTRWKTRFHLRKVQPGSVGA